MDITDYLDLKGIEYKRSGKNIGKGFIGISECLFCQSPGFHMGVNIDKGYFTCWSCSTKGNVIKLIREIEKCSYSKAKKVANDLYPDDFEDDDREEVVVKQKNNIIPKEAKNYLYEPHINYLQSRNFNPEFLKRKYSLYSCLNLGKYRFRIIIPIIIDGKIVNFVARSISPEVNSKYLFPSNDEAILPVGHCIYNYDTLVEGDSAIIVEGPFDVFRLGNKTVATLGKKLTKAQLNLLAEKELERVTIIPDEGAADTAEEIANQVSGVVDNVEVVTLPAGDPGDLTLDEVKELREFIGI